MRKRTQYKGQTTSFEGAGKRCSECVQGYVGKKSRRAGKAEVRVHHCSLQEPQAVQREVPPLTLHTLR